MKLVKSKQRVADHGEVFTPDWLVEAIAMTPVLWGYPSRGVRPSGVVLAGCVIPGQPAAWKCPVCSRGFQQDLSEGDLGAARSFETAAGGTGASSDGVFGALRRIAFRMTRRSD